jgi:hypothetical protein
VLLTPGPYNETYYEQAYLARYLGLPLVEGGDLTVRNGVVYLKTLSGMQRVHVIVRRVDDEACDPLELRSAPRWGGRPDRGRAGAAMCWSPTASARACSNRALCSASCRRCARRLLGDAA